MRHRNTRLAALVGLLAGAASAMAQTEFTYQGQLKDAGLPADGLFDLRFGLFDAATGGSLISPVLPLFGVSVTDGLFTVEIDLGPGAFDGNPRWLQIEVRADGSGPGWTMLTPRQPLTAVPYAMFAFNGPGGAGGFWAASGANIFNNNAGNVGIGTDSPLDQLHVRGEQATLRLEDDDDAGSFTELKDAQPTQLRINKTNSNGTVLLDLNPNPADGISSGLIRFFRETNTSGPKAVHFYRGNFTTQASASVGVDGANSWFQVHGGNLGIGTSTPGAKLHVAGTAGVDGIMFPDGTLQTSAAGTGGGHWSANGSNIFYNNGNVGIGTSSPAANLEVRSTTFPRLRIAKIHTGGFGVEAPAVLELKSNLTGSELPFGALRFLDGDDAERGSVEYGAAPGLVPLAMRFVTEGVTRMNITDIGDVGIGTASPQSRLHVVGAENNGIDAALRVQSGSQQMLVDGNEIDTNTTVGLYLNNNVPHNVILANGGGNVGIGTTNPSARLHAVSESGTGVRGVSNSASGYGGTFGDLGTPGKGLLVVGESHLLSPVGIGTVSVPGGVMLAVDGTARVDVLEIVGADVAERFPTSESAAVEPGTVMEIDPDSAGNLRIARGAYNRRVAGVVSGAGDLPVGAVLGHLPGHEDAPAIALSGRVWVHCDAGAHAISPGDLLTTSDTRGHAMKATDPSRSHGAVIGKAMTALEQGKTGLVLVLVNLQ